jgi:transcriptional regulator with GAF, ATPase, and Fis domain
MTNVILALAAERSLLLSFSNDLATVKDINGLRFMLKQYLKQIFRIREYIITIRNGQDNTYGYFLHDWSTDDPGDEGGRLIVDPKMSITSDMTAAVLRSDEPVTFRVPSFWRTTGMENILAVRLKVAEDDIGILWLQAFKADKRLLRGISAQIAIAISNAANCREIERQTEEIRGYKRRLENENYDLPEEAHRYDDHGEIIGEGPEMKKIYQAIGQVAFCNSTVLILGETGTGKELIARAVHGNSARKNKRMIKVNCAALPVNLIESELFGHERGSFTGAVERKMGKFELANNSTIFLDEIGELPPDLQVRLLRAIQEKEIERVGGKRTIKVNVRIVAATNRDLQKEVAEGRFRSDLYYRLNVFPIFVPALRHRLEDIPLLVSHFIQKLAGKTGKNVTDISAKALEHLVKHNWPGNIRELENCIERSLLLSDRPVIEQVELAGFGGLFSSAAGQGTICKTLRENERDHIIAILKKCNGKVGGSGGAAEILDVNTSTLNSRMRKLGIRRGRLIG